MLDMLVELADKSGVRERMIVVHADLGDMEWSGTKELAQLHAEHYGLRFEVTSRTKGDLLQQVMERGMWPSSKARYCTSDQKRDPIRRVMTSLVRELGLDRRVKILNCMGLRAQESRARAKRPSFMNNPSASNKTKRTVDDWLPIHDWTEEQVWSRIKESGLPHHRAYDLGMSRLSCVFCIFARPHELKIAADNNPELYARYVDVEKKIGHSFTMKLQLADLLESEHP